MQTDVDYMRQVIALALTEEGNTSPNPIVGCILVANNTIIAAGAHARAGGPHAEVHAIRKALKKLGKIPKNTTLYVNLEPCCHTGRTPPCTDLIIASGITRVVYGMDDPNPRVAGQGKKTLMTAGIAVTAPVLELDCRDLNRVFITNMEKNRPFISLKLAASLDGFIADQHQKSKWITGNRSRERVHKLRATADAVIVGVGTVLADNPSLNTRLRDEPQANTIVVIDTHLRIPEDAKLFQMNGNDNVIVALSETLLQALTTPNAHDAPACQNKYATLKKRGVRFLPLPQCPSGLAIKELVIALYQQGLTHLMIEGGSRIFSTFIAANLVDRLYYFIAPTILGAAASHLHAFSEYAAEALLSSKRYATRRVTTFEHDVLIELTPQDQHAGISEDDCNAPTAPTAAAVASENSRPRDTTTPVS